MSRRHCLARQSGASRACRRTTGLADCARWLLGVVFVTFPCLFPLHKGTAAAHSCECAQVCGGTFDRCSQWRCPPRLGNLGVVRRTMLWSSLAAPDLFATPHFPISFAQKLTCCKFQFWELAVLKRRFSCRLGRCHGLGTRHAEDLARAAISPLDDVVFSTLSED